MKMSHVIFRIFLPEMFCIMGVLRNSAKFTGQHLCQSSLQNIYGGFANFNPFVSNAPLLYPLKTSENLTVFRCFQGVEEKCIGNEWIKMRHSSKRFSWRCISNTYLLILVTFAVHLAHYLNLLFRTFSTVMDLSYCSMVSQIKYRYIIIASCLLRIKQRKNKLQLHSSKCFCEIFCKNFM